MKRAFSDKNGDYLAAPAEEDGDKTGVEMRNQISVAYKNRVAARRTAFRQVELCMTGTLDNFKDLPDDQKASGEAYKNKIAGELKGLIEEVCNDVVAKFVEGDAAATDPEVLVFFHKMAGDYNRYGAEITAGEVAYKKASELAEQLQSTNPISLGLALNYSVFMYEIAEKKTEASELAKNAFDDAIAKLDKLDEYQYRDSTLIMQLLKDNLSLWTDDQQ